MIGAAIFIVLILLFSGIYYSFIYFKDESEDEQIDTEEVTLDDQISPLVNQGVVLEVLRIRHRGLLDTLLQWGSKWKQQPVFFFVSNIDDQEYVSKDIEGAGGVVTEDPFEGWDTMFQEHKIMRDTLEGQETSDIALSIVEMKTSGLLGRKTEFIERDSFSLIYDYRTGHWTGDDYLGDSDGYGHYLGETFEIWFNVYQIDYDGDKIPYWTEVNVYGTNPQVDDRYLDPDNDGIPTSWEWKYGYDPLTWDDHEYLDPDVDGIENIEEYKISKWFADPFSPDIYIEVDGMEKGGLLDPAHVLYDECIQAIIERFAQHGLNVYFDNGWPAGPINGGGELVRHVETLSQDAGQFLQFYNNNFADERKGIFRYCVIGHNTGYSHPSDSNKVDCLSADSSLYKLYFKRFAFTQRTQRIVIASATMHELGHSLGIHSWTYDSVDSGGYDNPEYRSIMNYKYIFNKKLLDYSSGENGVGNDQDDWGVLYLPHFQDVDVVIEEPYFTRRENREDFIVEKNPEPILPGWEYDINLTEHIGDMVFDVPTFYFDSYDYRIYVRTNDSNKHSDKDARLYVMADIDPTHTLWVLVSEAMILDDDVISCYSFNDKIEQLTG